MRKTRTHYKTAAKTKKLQKLVQLIKEKNKS